MEPVLVLLTILASGAFLIAAGWSLYRSVPRFGLFLLGAMGFPAWLFGLAIIPGIGKLIWLGLTIYFGFAWFAVYHYRRIRRDEFLQLLATAAESQLPIEEVLSQELNDSPTHPFRRLASSVICLLVPPFWFRSGRYDEQMRRLIYYLEMGFPPAVAVASVRGLASQETELALFVGESTGRLASRSASPDVRSALAPALLENLPRLAYLVLVLFGWLVVSTFLVVFIVPKYEKIFADFKVALPESTQSVISFSRFFAGRGGLFALLFVTTFGMLGVLLSSPTVRWHVPLVRRIVRPWMQSRFLAMLGTLLEAGKSVPRSLELLQTVPFFGGNVARRIGVVGRRVDEGRPLIESLRDQQLMPSNLAPLAVAAERSRSLPWALQEMGEHLGRRTVQRVQRLSLVVFPIVIVALGAMTMWFAIGMFAPLVRLLEALNL